MDNIEIEKRRQSIEKEYLAAMDFYRNHKSKNLTLKMRYNAWVRNGKPVITDKELRKQK